MSKPNIICVDDERIILDSLKEQLIGEFGSGYHIEIAESSGEALGIIAELRSAEAEIPLIITDYIMPDMKGDELLRRVSEVTPRTVAVLLTGQATLKGVANAVNYGRVFKFISKPWQRENLYATVAEALNHYYHDRLRVDQNRQLYEMNLELEQTLARKTNKLQENEKTLGLTGRVNDTQHIIAEITDKINESLLAIKSGINLVHVQHNNIYKDNPEGMASYKKSADGFYQMTSMVIESLLEVFNQNTVNCFLQPVAVKSGPDSSFQEALAKTSILRQRISENVTELLGKIGELETQFNKTVDKVVAWDEEEILLFNLEDVLFFTSEEGKTMVVTKKGKYKVRDAIENLEIRLSSQNFFRCHRSFLINLKYINKITPWIGNNYISKLEGSQYEIPISRNRLKEIKRILGI